MLRVTDLSNKLDSGIKQENIKHRWQTVILRTAEEAINVLMVVHQQRCTTKTVVGKDG